MWVWAGHGDYIIRNEQLWVIQQLLKNSDAFDTLICIYALTGPFGVLRLEIVEDWPLSFKITTHKQVNTHAKSDLQANDNSSIV